MAPLRTPLHAWHRHHDARMALFGGYDMPLWYASTREEHCAVLTGAGIFDTCHMAVVAVQGGGAFDLLQFCFTIDLNAPRGPRLPPLAPGRAVYGAFLNATGHVIDDAIVFMVAADAFLVVVNAGMGSRIAAHLAGHCRQPGVTVNDLSGQIGKLDLQGPRAARILQQILRDPEQVFAEMPYFAFQGGFSPAMPGWGRVTTLSGMSLLLSRTGYTGEFGFELFTPLTKVTALWKEILAAGGGSAVLPCGLAARDSLRTGAVLPLSHQDIGDWPFCRHPWPFALPYTKDRRGFTKAFLGAEALIDCAGPYTYPFVGRDLRKVALPAVVRDAAGQPIGDVLTCVTDMAMGRCAGRLYSLASPDQPKNFSARGLCCGFVRVTSALAPDTRLVLEDNRRRIDVDIVRDIRPDRTARQPLQTFLSPKEV